MAKQMKNLQTTDSFLSRSGAGNSAKKKDKTIMALVLTTILIAAAVISFLFLPSGSTDSESAPQSVSADSKQASVESEDVIQPLDVIQSLESKFAANYTLLDMDEDNQPDAHEMSVGHGNFAPVYKVDGYDYFVHHDQGASLSLMPGPIDWSASQFPSLLDIGVRKAASDTYRQYGLVFTTTRGDAKNGTGYDIYEGKGLVCTIESIESAVSPNSARCGKVTDYSEVAARVKPFAVAMPSSDSTTVFADPLISDSEVEGYKKAHVGVGHIEGGGSTALFYKAGSGSWVYFAGVQQALSCETYTTDDVRRAFKGSECYDGSSQNMLKV